MKVNLKMKMITTTVLGATCLLQTIAANAILIRHADPKDRLWVEVYATRDSQCTYKEDDQLSSMLLGKSTSTTSDYSTFRLGIPDAESPATSYCIKVFYHANTQSDSCKVGPIKANATENCILTFGLPPDHKRTPGILIGESDYHSCSVNSTPTHDCDEFSY